VLLLRGDEALLNDQALWQELERFGQVVDAKNGETGGTEVHYANISAAAKAFKALQGDSRFQRLQVVPHRQPLTACSFPTPRTPALMRLRNEWHPQEMKGRVTMGSSTPSLP